MRIKLQLKTLIYYIINGTMNFYDKHTETHTNFFLLTKMSAEKIANLTLLSFVL